MENDPELEELIAWIKKAMPDLESEEYTEKKLRKILQDEAIRKEFEKICPHCRRKFLHPETPGSEFCCLACDWGF